jgi:seryl-tRNA synthetase
MHDIRLIRDDPAAFDAALARRGIAAASATILQFDTIRRARMTMAEQAIAERNRISTAIGPLTGRMKSASDADRPALAAEIDALKAKLGDKSEIEHLEREASEVGKQLDDLLAALPNLPAADVPAGEDETGNVVVSEEGQRPTFDFAPREHFDFGPALGLDFETAQTVSGARFAYLRGPAARLSRALGQFMLDVHTRDFGYEEVAPPVLVRDEAMFGTGQLPKFREDSFQTTDGRWLIPTSEVSLTNQVRERIVSDTDLPMRFAALTPCFRSEAGSAGRDTRGLIRQHQFEKVELVSITTPELSESEHERMTQAAEAILDRLALPYRRMLLCAGDMGFTARKTYDLEVWLPGQNAYREISSCSNCGDFQARRMNARYRVTGEKGTRFVHTLNGSGVAVGRALVAVLENYQQEGGAVHVPEVLIPYMGGATRLIP